MIFSGISPKRFQNSNFQQKFPELPEKTDIWPFYQNSRKTFTFVPFPVVLDRNPLVRLPRPETFPPWHHSTLLCTLTNNIFHEFRLDQLFNVFIPSNWTVNCPYSQFIEAHLGDSCRWHCGGQCWTGSKPVVWSRKSMIFVYVKNQFGGWMVVRVMVYRVSRWWHEMHFSVAIGKNRWLGFLSIFI